MVMKSGQFCVFSWLCAACTALIIVGMSTLHWVTTKATVLLVVGDHRSQYTYAGLRRWYTETEGVSQTGISPYTTDCSMNYGQCKFYTAGTWALVWGVIACLLLLIIWLLVLLGTCMNLCNGNSGKGMAASLMIIPAVCILIGACTYAGHLPTLDSSQHYSWSFALYIVGGGLSLLTAIYLLFTPKSWYRNSDDGVALAAPGARRSSVAEPMPVAATVITTAPTAAVLPVVYPAQSAYATAGDGAFGTQTTGSAYGGAWPQTTAAGGMIGVAPVQVTTTGYTGAYPQATAAGCSVASTTVGNGVYPVEIVTQSHHEAPPTYEQAAAAPAGSIAASSAYNAYPSSVVIAH